MRKYCKHCNRRIEWNIHENVWYHVIDDASRCDDTSFIFAEPKEEKSRFHRGLGS